MGIFQAAVSLQEATSTVATSSFLGNRLGKQTT